MGHSLLTKSQNDFSDFDETISFRGQERGGKEREREIEGEGFSLSIRFIPEECLPGFFVLIVYPSAGDSSIYCSFSSHKVNNIVIFVRNLFRYVLLAMSPPEITVRFFPLISSSSSSS